MRLNTDYSDIKRQIEELAISLRNCTDKYEFHEYNFKNLIESCKELL